MAVCSNCQGDLPAGATACPSCGTAVGAATGGTPTQIKFDLSALSHTDKVVGLASLVLLISLFLTWFSYNAGFGVLTASGLSAHGYLYIPLLISLAIIVLFALSATGLWSIPASSGLNRDQLLLIATTVSFVLVLIGFLSKPGGSGVGWNFGAFVGLIAAVVALVPLARPVIQARRAKGS